MLVYSDHAIEAHIVLFVLSGADAGRRLSNLPLTGLYTDGTRLYWWQFVQMPRSGNSCRCRGRAHLLGCRAERIKALILTLSAMLAVVAMALCMPQARYHLSVNSPR